MFRRLMILLGQMENMTNTTLPKDSSLQDFPALLLVGGLGTRLRPAVSSTPKPLALIGDIPFLQLLVLQLRSQGIRRIVMCTGFQSGQIKDEFGDGSKWDVAIEYSNETSPLGTAGAIKLAAGFLPQATEFLVLNGDSFLELDFRELFRFHHAHHGLATLAVHRVKDAARYGTVQLDAQNRIFRFSEKLGTPAPGTINGGVYIFNREVLRYIPEGPVSLEKDILPSLLEHGVFALEQNGMFIDIGTPEDYARAQALYENLYQAAVLRSQVGPNKSGSR
jgi:NDP-sugar pyrophosphorylase family protein